MPRALKAAASAIHGNRTAEIELAEIELAETELAEIEIRGNRNPRKSKSRKSKSAEIEQRKSNGGNRSRGNPLLSQGWVMARG